MVAPTNHRRRYAIYVSSIPADLYREIERLAWDRRQTLAGFSRDALEREVRRINNQRKRRE